MTGPPNTLVAVRDRRERAIALLSDRFADGALELDEYERRVTLAHTAENLAALDALVEDLGEVPVASTPAPSTQALVPAGEVPERRRLITILGGIERKGSWTMPRRLKVVSFMGGTVLDFREARLVAGVVELSIFTVMGGVHVIVPPQLSVETEGFAFMGGFEDMHRAPTSPDPDRALLRITGFAFMGGVHIETRLAGESSRAAQRRRSRERKDARRRERERDDDGDD